MYTIKDVAEAAGVSTATVSRCFNNAGSVSEETSRKVLQIAADMGFELKKYRRRSNKVINNAIGVLITEYNPFYAVAIEAIQHVAEKNGLTVLVCTSQEQSGREIHSLEILRSRVDGLIVVPTSQTAEYNARYLQELDHHTMPVVLLDRDLSNAQMDGVFVDGFQGALSAVQTLIANGHRDIAIISGPISNKPGLDRLNGYLEALRINNIPIREDYILYGEFQEKRAYELTSKLLKSRKNITAIFSANLVMAFGCLKAIDDNRMRIPDDIAFITFDDYFFYNMNNFRISVVDNPGYQLGEEAALFLMSRIQEGKRSRNVSSRRIILMPHLILRGSEAYPSRK